MKTSYALDELREKVIMVANRVFLKEVKEEEAKQTEKRQGSDDWRPSYMMKSQEYASGRMSYR